MYLCCTCAYHQCSARQHLCYNAGNAQSDVLLPDRASPACLHPALSNPLCPPHRYSRVLTCKTYLKRLNITQAMAEHLLPPHDLSAKPQPRASSDGGASDDEKGSSTYGTLFKDHVTIVDEHGITYRCAAWDVSGRYLC